MPSLNDFVGKTDVYLLDLILSGRVRDASPILDAGCGQGRNLHYFLREGFEVCAVDRDEVALNWAKSKAEDAGCEIGEGRFSCGELDNLEFEDNKFGLVICNAVLHFADDVDHFDRMADELWRVLRPGGILFCRLASNIGIEDGVEPLVGKPDRWHRIPDGSERFLVDLDFLLERTSKLGGTLLGPIKTVQVQGLRSMTNWVLGKT